MAITVGDLFVKVTANDRKFKQQMRGIQGTIRNFSNSVSRIAGLFGLAFGGAFLMGKAIESAAKFSGVFALALANSRLQMIKIKIAMGQAFGPVLAAALNDFTALFTLTEDGEKNLKMLGLGLLDIYNAIKLILKPVKWLFQALAAFGGSEFLYTALGPLRPATWRTGYQEMLNSQGMSRKGLEQLQQDTPATIRQLRENNPLAMHNHISEIIKQKLIEIEQHTRGPR